MKKFAWALPVVVFGAVLVARAGDKEAHEHEAYMKEWMEKYSMPGAEHKMLEYFAGEWTFKNKSFMGGTETVSDGTAHCEMAMGGRYLHATHKSVMEGMPFEGYGITGFDRVNGEYFNVWFDNMGTGYMEAHGAALEKGKGFELTGLWDDPIMGEMDFRMRTEIHGDDSYTFRMYMSPADGDEELAMEIKYTRVSS
jgi:hypothetical protein